MFQTSIEVGEDQFAIVPVLIGQDMALTQV